MVTLSAAWKRNSVQSDALMTRRPRPATPTRQKADIARDASQPNEMDWRRIERALEKRERYRYVSPSVIPEHGGYRIASPCCSRKVDPEGREIDIARLEYDAQLDSWHLYSKDHARNEWLLQADGRLHELLSYLNADPQRIFWQ